MSAPASAYDPDKLPYRLKWGGYTVVAEVKRDKDGEAEGKQVRIVDARGRTLRQVGSDRVDAVRLVKPLVAGEEGLLVRLSGGNSGLADFYGFGAGASRRFLVADALDVAVEDLGGTGTAEVVATYRFSDVDGGGEHHGPRVTAVYQWDGQRFAGATRRFPERARARAKEYQAQLLALGHDTPGGAGVPPRGGDADKGDADKGDGDTGGNDGHLNAALAYLANAGLAGDGAAAEAWLKSNVAADRLRMTGAVYKRFVEELRSCLTPLPLEEAAGDDSGADAGAVAGAGGTAGPPAPDGPPPAGPAPPGRVVAGEACGRLRLGMSRGEVRSLLGKPGETHSLPGGVTEDLWAPQEDGRRNVDVLYRDGAAVQIDVSSPAYSTAAGVSTAAPFRRVLGEYPGLSTASYSFEAPEGGGYIQYFYDDRRQGIAFGIVTQDDEASSELILGTNRAAHPTAERVSADHLIVHRPGVAVLVPTYGCKVTPAKSDRVMEAPYLYAHLRRGGR